MSVLATRPKRERMSTRAWWWTVSTGGALLVLMTVHMVAQHFVVREAGGLRTYHEALAYVGNPLMLATECALVVVVTIHAMLGLRSVLFDLALGSRTRRLVDRGLWVLGLATVAYGLALLAVLASRA